ncbi:hypothetical protein [Bradyrhizobium symbiodeficiens]|uniref:hypothetical protein n=1 Tax=Bradyrhizobium symbiodeficiens TaxID=1404367 RepID=UPI00140F6140|nr:hypothetical protein [Bradyrhizobium symbiodeficiens]QIP01259.1 hypothetical protein HAU86_16325 [Bradyrhizobium symbiodeficiens]
MTFTIWSNASSSDAVGRSSPLGDRPRAVGNPTEGALDDDECRGGLDDLAGVIVPSMYFGAQSSKAINGVSRKLM